MTFGYKNLFSDQQAVTGTAASEDVIHFEEGGGNVGDGQNLRVYAQVTEDFAMLTSLQVQLQHSDDNGSWTTVLSGPVVPVGDLVAGKELIDVTVPKDMEAYHRLNYVVAGTNATAGKVFAGYLKHK